MARQSNLRNSADSRSRAAWSRGAPVMLALVLLAAATGVGLRRAVTRPAPLFGIPTRDYQFGERSALASMLSMPVVEVLRVNTPRGAKRVKTFQFKDPQLRVDHCEISGVALQLFDDGTYVLSLRAAQNEGFVAAGQSAGGPEVELAAEQTQVEEGVDRQLTRTEAPSGRHLLRNEFHLQLLLFGAYSQDEPPTVGVGKPVIVQLAPKPFFVERGRIENYYSTGCIHGVRRFFEMFERAELQFSYR